MTTEGLARMFEVQGCPPTLAKIFEAYIDWRIEQKIKEIFSGVPVEKNPLVPRVVPLGTES